jgi:hypothetical protein
VGGKHSPVSPNSTVGFFGDGSKVIVLTSPKHPSTPPSHFAGGIGKSVFAAQLCHDEHLNWTYPDGTFWVQVKLYIATAL